MKAALTLIEETVPVNLILAQFADHQASQAPPFHTRPNDLQPVLTRVIAFFKMKSMTDTQIRNRLLTTEPFAAGWSADLSLA